MIGFTPSSFSRVRQCAASAVLPGEKFTGNEYTERGTTVHEFVPVAGRMLGRDAALAAVAGRVGADLCERIDLSAIPTDYDDEDHVSHEVPIAYDTAKHTARRLVNTRAARDYRNLARTEIAGTIDALTIKGGALIVDDLKTGRPDRAYRHQLELYALMASPLVPDLASVECRLIYIDGDGSVMVDAWPVTSLDDVRADLLSTVKRVAEARERWRIHGRADVSPGEHCKYCPARMKSCPASHEAAQALATTDPTDALATYRASLATPEGRGNAWARLPLLEAMVATMRTELDAAIIRDGGVTPQGETLGAVTTERRRVADAQAAYDWLRSWHCTTTEQADAICPASTTRTATLGALERVLGRAEARRAIEGLEACGAIQTSVSTKAGVVKARKGKAA